jgi:hypothetical protein
VAEAIRTTAAQVGVAADGTAGAGGLGGIPGQRPARRNRHRSPRVALTMSVETLLGVREHAAQVDGWGPTTASHARRLAVTEGATWRRILTDPVSGSVLDVGRTRYTPTAAITDHVLTRDGGRCTRPGCSHQARDLDHAEAWDDGGTTDVGNLHAVCRGCHTAKHRRGTGNWTAGCSSTGVRRSSGAPPTATKPAPCSRTCDPRIGCPHHRNRPNAGTTSCAGNSAPPRPP